jgi:hypothetical protein
LEGIHCTDKNLEIDYQDGESSEIDNVTNMSRDLDLSEPNFVIACQASAFELLLIAFIHVNCDFEISKGRSDLLQLAEISTQYSNVPGTVVCALL